MAIHNIHILIDPEAKSYPVLQVKTRKGNVSQHVVVNKQEGKKWVFGWDQHLLSFYLQVHDLSLSKDEQITAWLGADRNTFMYEVEDLVQVANMYGLVIDQSYQTLLYGEKDEGK